MPIPLSSKSRRVAELLFSGPRRARLMERLIVEASETIPFHGKSNSSDLDRIRFSIMKLVSIPGSGEDAIFDLARTAWRDLFVAAGFNSADEHHHWYQSLVPDGREESETTKRPWWAFWRRK